MTRTPLRWLAIVVVLCMAAAAVHAKAGQVSAELIASDVVTSDDSADVTFTIQVTNGGASTAADVRIVFADGAEVAVGDVAGESKASSESQRRVIARTAATHNLPIEATLKYTSGGESVEESIVLTVRVSQ